MSLVPDRRDVECYVEARVKIYNRTLGQFSEPLSLVPFMVGGAAVFGSLLRHNIFLGVTGIFLSFGLYKKYGTITGETIVKRPEISGFIGSLQGKSQLDTKEFKLTEKEWSHYKPHQEDSIYYIHNPPFPDLEKRQ